MFGDVAGAPLEGTTRAAAGDPAGLSNGETIPCICCGAVPGTATGTEAGADDGWAGGGVDGVEDVVWTAAGIDTNGGGAGYTGYTTGSGGGGGEATQGGVKT